MFLNFVALQAARVPSVPESFEKPSAQVYRKMLSLQLANPERWERVRERFLRETGEELPDYDEARSALEALRAGRVRLVLAQNYKLALILQAATTIYDLLVARSWFLLRVNSEVDGGFVTSDRPVVITWTVDAPAWWSPGFGMPRTEVLVPLSRDLALVGIFDDAPPDQDIDRETLARANSRVVSQATRALYSAYADFVLLDIEGENVVSKDELLEHLERLRRECGSPEESNRQDEAG